jgi:nicotinamidase-related amidase
MTRRSLAALSLAMALLASCNSGPRRRENVGKAPPAVAAALSAPAGGAVSAGLPAGPAADPAPPTPAPLKKAEYPGSALLVMDMQRAFMPIARQDETVANIQRLVAAADEEGATVIWVYTETNDLPRGSAYYQLLPSLVPAERHLSLVKRGQSAFRDTELEKMLDAAGVGRLVVCGIASDQCVASTIVGGRVAGYRIAVAEDAHSVHNDLSNIARMNNLWRKSGAVEVLPTDEVRFSASP